jgi:glyoxylase-like metal-dependent hydrolase (beta-lactamase superfamily II)
MGFSQSVPSSEKASQKQDFDPAKYFTINRLNSTTHVIQEHDVFHESPLIYVKHIRGPVPIILICDTGCGTTHRSGGLNGPLHNLRSFIETYPVPSNSDKPLNPDGRLPYLILCTHCHYDHILGIPQFAPEACHDNNAIIIASSHSPSFLSFEHLPIHSLCTYLGLATPRYHVRMWAGDEMILYFRHRVVGYPGSHITTLHIPGHTPDSLAWYDEFERWIYVGDTFYERYEGGGASGPGEALPIEFPSEGDLVAYMGTLDKLLEFVRSKNGEDFSNSSTDEDWQIVDANSVTGGRIRSNGEDTANVSGVKNKRIRLGCGHVTSSVDAEEIILAVQDYFWKLFKGEIPVQDGGKNEREEQMGFWEESETLGRRRFSVLASCKLVEEARKHFKILPPQNLAF